jgi:hypothetical protein
MEASDYLDHPVIESIDTEVERLQHVRSDLEGSQFSAS